MVTSLWSGCLRELQSDLSETDFNTWIRPLQAVEDQGTLRLLAPNQFVVNWVSARCLGRIREVVARNTGASAGPADVVLQIGSRDEANAAPVVAAAEAVGRPRRLGSKLNPLYTFERFVEGKSNQLARAAAMQVARNPGNAYNPLFIYGGGWSR